MKIRKLLLKNFGPFNIYEMPFVNEEHVCMLLTGKNNEGKSNILLALKLVDSALKSIQKTRQRIIVKGNVFYRLPLQDVQGINIGRMIYNYEGTLATIEATLDDNFEVIVFLDASSNMIYADSNSKRVPHDVQNILGFIPPLGPLAENEENLSEKHIKANINTSLAPRHLRNHLSKLLSYDEYKMVQTIIKDSWPTIELLDYERHFEDNTIRCFFKENRIERELAWAGQGLQIWFQIVAHLVRLRSKSILVLDEPEVNLHPEKQNDLIRILREYHMDSVIVATHSVELMNNLNVSHIVHVQKRDRKPRIKTTNDRTALDLIRSRVGSNFNLIASQFENCDLILFTEDSFDFSIISNLAQSFGLKQHIFNIPIHGFSEYRKSVVYKEAYGLLIGWPTAHTMLLDRDYYPDNYLAKIKDELEEQGIRTLFTPGKEIENLFIIPKLLDLIIPSELEDEFNKYWNSFFNEIKLDCYASYLTLHEKFLIPRVDTKTLPHTLCQT